MKNEIKTESAPAAAGEYHVIRTSHGRTELQLSNKPVGDLTASPAIADAVCNMLVERTALLAERDRLKTTLRLCLSFLESAAFLNRAAFDTCAWETLRDAAALRAEGVRAALAEGGK